MSLIASEPFSIAVLEPTAGLPAWHPAFTAPGVIVEIPSSGSIAGGGNWGDSSFQAAVNARLDSTEDWTPPPDIVSGGVRWPNHLWGYSGGCLAYVLGQPYLLVFGGGHRNGPDNVIYSFGPLYGEGSDNPQWAQLSQRSAEADMRTCATHNADGRPTPRHSSGDFSYGNGKICMLWRNSTHCSNGGVSKAVEVYDVDVGEWDNARGISHSDPGDFRKIKQHGNSVFVPSRGLFYSLTGETMGSYNPFDTTVDGVAPRSWRNHGRVSNGVGGDSMCCVLGDESGGLASTLFTFDRGPGSSTEPQKIDLDTLEIQSWATGDYPTRCAQAVAYDSAQQRLYACNSGINTGGNRFTDPGTGEVAWVDVNHPDPAWNHETLHGVTPVSQYGTGTYGRWSYVRELNGFVLSNGAHSPVYFYRTS